MSALLNIGLAVEGGEPVTPSHALAALRARLGVTKLLGWSLEQSDTEPTVVAELSAPLPEAALSDLSVALHQDCVAQWDGSHGLLAGPKAADWAPFNPAFFLLPSGERLAQ